MHLGEKRKEESERKEKKLKSKKGGRIERCHHEMHRYESQCHTMRNSAPSNLRTEVKTTVLAGMLRPIENVSVEKSTFRKPSCYGVGGGVAREQRKAKREHRVKNKNQRIK